MWLTIPVTPDAETAQEWAREELSDPLYSSSDSLLDRLGAWLSEKFFDLLADAGGTGIPALGYLIATAVVAVLIVVAIRVAGPALAQRSRSSNTVLDDDTRSASQIEASAREAHRRGDFSAASLEYFRAMVRASEERVILDERAGRTAHEAATDIGASLSSHRDVLAAGSRRFDALCYGHREATQRDADLMLDLMTTVASARPDRKVSA